jgi:hypothetical protein
VRAGALNLNNKKFDKICKKEDIPRTFRENRKISRDQLIPTHFSTCVIKEVAFYPASVRLGTTALYKGSEMLGIPIHKGYPSFMTIGAKPLVM